MFVPSISRLGELLLNENLITREQLEEALQQVRTGGVRLGSFLVKRGYVGEDDLTQVLSRQYGIPSVNLALFEAAPEVLKLLPREVAMKYQVLPLRREGSVLQIATAEPNNFVALDEIKFRVGMQVESWVASESQILAAIERVYVRNTDQEMKKIIETLGGPNDGTMEVLDDEDEPVDAEELERESEEAPVVRFVNLILREAVSRGASDIHIEPYEREFRVRFRVDGVLQTIMSPPLKQKDVLTSRIKILAKMNISEKRVPQDGRIKIVIRVSDTKSKQLDFRVSSLPTLFGEKIVLRLLDKENLMFDMRKLGFDAESLRLFENAIDLPYGMVLVTGPTGSGKTNTLYSAISRLNRPNTNIMTAEDPVEFNMPGINQVNVRQEVGLTFAAALRSFLRQDPNIILVGEIRDVETAEIAIKAALTGHMVLSTLHTNDAPGTVSRLINMGIEPFLVATAINLVCAQRLVRRICTACKVEEKVPMEALIDVGFTPEEAESVKVMKGEGCPACSGTGYKGRVGLYEVMAMTDAVREPIIRGATSVEVKQRALESGMVTLRRSGLMKIMEGITTIEEVLRETVR